MKWNQCNQTGRGFTLIELVVLMALVMIIWGLVPCAASSSKGKAQRINCVNNLKQVGLAYRLWGEEQAGAFPMEVSTNKKGTLEWGGKGPLYHHFVAISNELVTPKIPVCPADFDRSPAQDFTHVTNQNLSYFLAMNTVHQTSPNDMLLGDRNLAINSVQFLTGSYFIPTQQIVTWSASQHKRCGNVALTDGSVQQASDTRLQATRANGNLATNWIVFP